MKVKDLIAFLQTQDQTLDVMVPGYEEGYNDVEIERINIVPLARKVLDKTYYGPHVYPWYHDYDDPDAEKELKHGVFKSQIKSALIFHRGPIDPSEAPA